MDKIISTSQTPQGVAVRTAKYMPPPIKVPFPIPALPKGHSREDARQTCELVSQAIKASGRDYGWGSIALIEAGVITKAEGELFSNTLANRFIERNPADRLTSGHAARWADAATFALLHVWGQRCAL